MPPGPFTRRAGGKEEGGKEEARERRAGGKADMSHKESLRALGGPIRPTVAIRESPNVGEIPEEAMSHKKAQTGGHPVTGVQSAHGKVGHKGL